MTSRERLLSALAGQPGDRAPVWLLFPYHRTGYYADVRTSPTYAEVFERSKQQAVMLDRRNAGVRLWTPDVEERAETFRDGEWTVRRTTVRGGGVELFSEHRERAGETRIRKLLDSEADLDALLRLPVDTDPARIHAQLDQHLATYLAERAEFPPEYGAMMLDLGEPIGQLYGRANLEELSVWSLTASAKVAAFLDRAMAQKRLVYEYCLERDLADVYFMVGSELAAPPLVGLDTYRRWIVPYATELIARVHARGKFVIQHHHGAIRSILPEFLTMQPDGLHTIEAPPVGDCTLSEAYEITGARITLIGNIQYDCFRAYTPAEMRAAVRDVLREVRGRRFILSPTAGPYEPTISDRMRANYLAFLDAAWED